MFAEPMGSKEPPTVLPVSTSVGVFEKVSEVEEATADASPETLNWVPLTMEMMTVPLGMPVPLTVMPTAKPEVLVVVSVLALPLRVPSVA